MANAAKNKWMISLILIAILIVFSGCSPQQLMQAQDALQQADALFSQYAQATLDNTTSESPVPSHASSTVNGVLQIHFLDVGQADCALVLCDGYTMLIDGGNQADADFVTSYLLSQGIAGLDYVICTHAHEDHVGGLPSVLNAFPVQHVLCSVEQYDSKIFTSFCETIQAKSLSLEIPACGDTFSLGQATVTVLGPVQSYPDTNDMSLVLRIDYGQTSFLFMGDAEKSAEEDLLSSGANLSATLLKAGHHGSDTSSSYVFLREVMPEYAVISVGTNNSYGHPDEAVLSRLHDAGTQIFRTDESGCIIAVSDGASLQITTEK